MSHRAHKIGLDANQPIITEGERRGALAERLLDPEIIAGSGAAWVRINFVLGPWSRPNDQTRYHQGRTWADTYGHIIDQYRARGLNIYGLIGHEAVKSGQGLPDFFREHWNQTPDHDRGRGQQWIADYVNNFVEIVKLFHQKMEYFESFNEPDDWHNQKRAWIHPTWFAVMLDEIYRKVKKEVGIHHVKLISGPLQGLEANNNDAPTKYLRETYQYGKERLGWGRDNPYPFDGVGYHLYIKEHFNSNWTHQEREVRQTYRSYVDGMLRVIRQAEGTDTTKKLYISEIGWPSNNDTPEEKEFQAKNLSLALDLLVNDPAVALGIWFCTEDFDKGNKFYGLYQMGRVSAEGRKPALRAFQDYCERLNQANAAFAAVQSQPVIAAAETPPARPAPEEVRPVTPPKPPLQQEIAGAAAGVTTPAGSPSADKPLKEQLAELRAEIAGIKDQLPKLAEQLRAPATAGAVSPEVAELKNQTGELQRQVQLIQSQMAQFQSQLQQLFNQPAPLQGQGSSRPSQPAAQLETGLAAPPAPSPSSQPAAKPALFIQDIMPDLKRHPTLPPYPSRSLGEIQRLIIHHTAVDPTIGAERIAAHRVDKQGWPGIGYHYFITHDGRVQQTNQLTTVARHAERFNQEAVGICFAGNFTDTSPTPAQLEAGAQLIASLLRQFDLSIQAVAGYKELVATESPGKQWDAGERWGAQLRERIQAYLLANP